MNTSVEELFTGFDKVCVVDAFEYLKDMFFFFSSETHSKDILKHTLIFYIYSQSYTISDLPALKCYVKKT